MLSYLLSADAGDASGAAPAPVPPAETTAPEPAREDARPTADPAPPIAASTVINGKTERELQLEAELAAARDAKKKAEIEHAEMQDRLRQSQRPAPKEERPFRLGFRFGHE